MGDDEEIRSMKAHKWYWDRVEAVQEAQHGIPTKCPCGKPCIKKVDEEDPTDYKPGKSYFICSEFENDGLHFRQPWVTRVETEFDSMKRELRLKNESLKECLTLTHQKFLGLVGAWLNTSKDPITSNEQKGVALWKIIAEYFNSNPLVQADNTPRENVQCKQRWSRINDQVCKFVGCYDAALKAQRSGENENDVMKAAMEIFHNDTNSKFSMEHCWRELRHDQKWRSTYVDKDIHKEKRKALGEDHVEEEVVVVPAPESRPPGVKAEKAALKKKKTPEEAKYEKMQGMLELKDRIKLHTFLDRLLAKSELLSEAEESLKLKLITYLL